MLDIVRDKTEDILSLLENIGYMLINEHSKHSYKTFKKNDGSLLTELDIMSDLIIKNELKSLFGNISILSEENEESENKNIATQPYFFLLDPIDGTSSFHQGGEFTINLSFCQKRVPMIGFIHNPIRKITLFGDSNKSFKRTNGKITKLTKLKKINYEDYKTGKKQLNITLGKKTFQNKQLINDYLQQIRECGYSCEEKNIHSASAMGKMVSLLKQECDIFISAKCCKDWDILPTLPILQSIGAYYFTKNQSVFFNNNFDQNGFVVANDENILNDLKDIF